MAPKNFIYSGMEKWGGRMRKTYETEEDRSNERQVIDLIHELWNINVFKLPISYGLDFAMIDNRENGMVLGFLEVKKRSTDKSQYSSYMISLSKVMKARELTQVSNLPSLLVVQWRDESGWINFSDELNGIGFGGRSDRSDWQDQEPVAFMKTHNFKPIERRANKNNPS